MGCDAFIRFVQESHPYRVGIWTGTQMNREDCRAKSYGENILSITKCGKHKALGVKKGLEGRKSERQNLQSMHACLDFIQNTLGDH